jgi:hypothetical protein
MLDEWPSPCLERKHALREESRRALFEQNKVRFPGTPGQVEDTPRLLRAGLVTTVDDRLCLHPDTAAAITP